MSIRKPSKRLRIRVLLGLFFSMSCYCICGFPFWLFLGRIGGAVAIQSLEPPQYPGSTLIDDIGGVTPIAGWKYHGFKTYDSVDKVLAFMNKALPGFTLSDDGKNIYKNKATLSYFSPLQLLAPQAFDPFMEIWIESNGSSTEIKIWFYWPSYD